MNAIYLNGIMNDWQHLIIFQMEFAMDNESKHLNCCIEFVMLSVAIYKYNERTRTIKSKEMTKMVLFQLNDK